MTSQSVNPVTGKPFGPEIADTPVEIVNHELQRAHEACREWATAPAERRAAVLGAIADRLDDNAKDLARLAHSETGLGFTRLIGEVARSTFQFRLFQDLITHFDQSRGEVDEAVDGPPPAGRPRLHRRHVPLGPVAVFGASNFPFAFGVCGGDTASALAAGCPVVVKAHPSHPQTSIAIAAHIADAIASVEAPAGIFGLVHGMDAGTALVLDPRIRAGAFTGSRSGGRALFDLANSRPMPIPFYGELGSVNPVVATPDAVTDPAKFASAYLDSLTLGAGQFCTNPSLLFTPRAANLPAAIAASLTDRSAAPLLNASVRSHLTDSLDAILAVKGASVIGHGRIATTGFEFTATVVSVPLQRIHDGTVAETECFGPVGVIVEYDDLDELRSALERLPGCLVATVHASAGEPVFALVQTLIGKAGRVTWNEWPTGLAVSRAQQHGGPYPATTNPLHTSVGEHAIERFLRPVVLQNFPEDLVPSLAATRAPGSDFSISSS